MDLNKIKELIKEEVTSQISKCFVTKIKQLDLEKDEFLILKLEGPFTEQEYTEINLGLKDLFGKKAIAIGSDKEYNIEIVKGKLKNE